MIPSLQAPSVPQHAAQTHAGRQQAEDLGRVFRMVMYPRYGSAGGGLLRLHSTYRHDLKIYSSDEGRVQVGGGVQVPVGAHKFCRHTQLPRPS